MNFPTSNFILDREPDLDLSVVVAPDQAVGRPVGDPSFRGHLLTRVTPRAATLVLGQSWLALQVLVVFSQSAINAIQKVLVSDQVGR